MDYYLVPDRETACENLFPERLSHFFEQVGGYHEQAEVSQLSRLLALDLSLFQDVACDLDDEAEAGRHWHPVEAYLLLLADFLARLAATPAYWTRVRHGPPPDGPGLAAELRRIAALADETQRDAQWAALEARHGRRYPPDHGYLPSGQLVRNLTQLQQALRCYQQRGVGQARLLYL